MRTSRFGFAALFGVLVLVAPSAALARPMIAVSPVIYSDTSGEPVGPGHQSRLKTMQAHVVDGLEKSGIYDAKLVVGPDCPDYSEACNAKWAKGTGGNLILVGTVLKTSTLISHFWVGIFKADGKTRLFYRDLQFRGDTDEAWSRAGDYLVQEIVKAKPGL